MIIKNIFTCIKNLVVTFVVSIFVLMNLGALLLVIFGIIEFSGEEWNTPQYHCADDGGVWDYDQKICRHDCLKWTEREKCIPLDADCEMYTDEKGCIPKAEVEAMKQRETPANNAVPDENEK